ncbi:hypothetical protein FN846DRAFT_933083 [Sphaerosporella brunnea]|uniref:Uncharacterized protein n=1 Tax=Sphaerosporella brunnea TaxID=1250544 RepID=A0A5J5F762_9PEZI|nr:hypothetical protein FN846DRAFT_933083 [Sphaerosporella brunnea]
MHDRGVHVNHLLQQIPLTVSPHIHLPTAVTLPYSYQSLPLGLPPPSTAPDGGGYITSPSGNLSQTPEEVIRTCHSLLQHLQTQRIAAEQALRDWEKSIDDRELMEKRRMAPGYLDTGIQILEPIRKSTVPNPVGQHAAMAATAAGSDTPASTEEGDELDRVFGKMTV